MMVRPTKYRAVEFFPEDDYFAPCKKMKCRAKSEVEEIILKIEELEAMRLELVEAQKDRKIMEKLKERDYTDYQNEVKAVEQKQLDEMAVLKFKPGALHG